MTVLLWGVPTEAPVAMVASELARLRADVVVVHPGAAAGQRVCAQIGPRRDPAGAASLCGTLRADGRTVDLAAIVGAYLRPVEPGLVPRSGGTEQALGQARRVYDALSGFTEVAPRVTGCRVANRLSAMSSNISKPFQAQAILRHGFAIPQTLVSDDPDEVLDFAGRHRGVVYKSCSGIRSVVTAFDADADRGRLHRLRWCPVQFQERVEGPDVRVHVIGDEVYAAIVDSTAVDYRYARAQVGTDARLRGYRLAEEVAGRCLALAASLDLPFAGIDLKLAPDGRVVCFEVNPSPGFSWYEQEAGLPIANAVARWLLGG